MRWIPGRLDVGAGVGEQLSGGMTLMPRHRQSEVLAGHAAPVRRLQPVLHDARAQPADDRTRLPRTATLMIAAAAASAPVGPFHRRTPARSGRRRSCRAPRPTTSLAALMDTAQRGDGEDGWLLADRDAQDPEAAPQNLAVVGHARNS